MNQFVNEHTLKYGNEVPDNRMIYSPILNAQFSFTIHLEEYKSNLNN